MTEPDVEGCNVTSSSLTGTRVGFARDGELVVNGLVGVGADEEFPGEFDGNAVGNIDGGLSGVAEGALEGDAVGNADGVPDGVEEGEMDGEADGTIEGNTEGEGVGAMVGGVVVKRDVGGNDWLVGDDGVPVTCAKSVGAAVS